MTTNHIPFNPNPSRLSEAIRLGRLVTRPAKFHMIRKNPKSGEFTACALGAAYVGTFCMTENMQELLEGAVTSSISRMRDALHRCYPILAHQTLDPVKPSEGVRTVCALIIRLNDSYYWDREQIADWIERLEEEVAAKEKSKTKSREKISV